MHESFTVLGFSNVRRDLRMREVERFAQHRFSEQSQLSFNLAQFQIPRDIGDRDAQEFLMPKGADRVESRFEVRGSFHQTRKLILQLLVIAPAPREIGSHQRVEHIGMANKQSRQITAGGEQTEQHAPGRGMLLQQRQK